MYDIYIKTHRQINVEKHSIKHGVRTTSRQQVIVAFPFMPRAPNAFVA